MKICFPRNKVNYDWESLLRSYQNHVSKEKTVLEIGASNVARTRELSKLCRKLIGVEIFLERKPDDFENVEYVTGDWQRLSEFMQPSTIDLAVSSHVIEHVEDDLR
ncbi:MAG: methyltransferase domain-containing protein, partial [Actinobacteria bacterium]|nr:methyltransferase domain-containing protein [Actinomycetota bacterium]